MKIDDFIRKYNSAKDKEKYLKESIKKTYIPYHEKVADCERVVRATTIYKENESDIEIFRLNTPAQFMIFTMNIISKYTEIEYDETLDAYEKLDQLNIINTLISYIPERERAAYNTLLNMVQDDYMENNRSLVSFIETKVKALGLSVDAILDAMSKYIPQNETEVVE